MSTGNTYDKYASEHPFERWLMGRFFAALDRSVPPWRPDRILEIGCGEGTVSSHVLARYPGATVVGMDLPSDDVGPLWMTPGFHGVFGDGCALPFPDDAFDLVLGIEVLEHVERPEAALAEIARVARRAVVVSVPREPIWRAGNLLRGRYISDLGNTPGHIQHWGKRSFARLVRRHLDVRRVSSPLPWTMVSAAVRRDRPDDARRSRRGTAAEVAPGVAPGRPVEVDQPGDELVRVHP